jgi:ATP-dependent exoDNAse (exonuclease V) beta subunit
MASEDLHGEQGTLMLVGDPKQSIYRWRGGKSRAIYRVEQRGKSVSIIHE